MFSKKTNSILINAGWDKLRTISTVDFQKTLKSEGYPVIDSTLNFLSSFGNLEIYFPSVLKKGDFDTIHFVIDRAVREVSSDWILGEYSERVGSKLCLIGQGFKNHMSLSIDENGRIFGGYDDLLILFGNSSEESIEAIFNKKEFQEIE